METKDYWSLGISILALCVTVIWNLHNRKHTNGIAKQIRSEAFTLDDWKTKRSDVLRALRDLEASFDRLRVLTTGAHGKNALDDQIANEGRTLTLAFNALQRELERIAPTWVVIAYGDEKGGETDWDQIHTILDQARQLQDPDAMRAHLKGIEVCAKSISTKINGSLVQRTAELDPANT
jgi:hypothetical protein